MNHIILTLILSIVSAVLYRLGGTSAGTKWRDAGCPLVALILWWALAGVQLSLWWAYLLTFGLSWGAMASYWGMDEQKWGFWAHGLGLSLAVLPLAFATGHWIGFGLRTILLTSTICLWSEYTKWDVLEETGRGFLFTASIPLLLL